MNELSFAAFLAAYYRLENIVHICYTKSKCRICEPVWQEGASVNTKHGKKSIQKKLFFSYLVLSAVTILTFLFIIYYFNKNTLMKKAEESLYQTANAIATEIEQDLEKANDLQKRILFSKIIKNLIFSDDEMFAAESVELQRQFNDYTNLVCGPDDYRNYQLNFLNFNGNFAGVGYNPAIKKLSSEELETIPFREEILEQDGKIFLTSPYETVWGSQKTKVISMCRAICEENVLTPTAIMETQIAFREIQRIIEKHISALDDLGDNGYVVMYNERGELVYCESDSESTGYFYIEQLKQSSADKVSHTFNNPKTQKDEVLVSASAKKYGWTILAIREKDIFLAPVRNLRNIILLIGIVVIGITGAITHIMAKQLSSPLREFNGLMTELQLEEIASYEPAQIETDILELAELNQVFVKMCKQLQDSLNMIVSIRAHEVQAKLLAMQAQMNPHFLYNILSIIKIMGKEAGSEQIVQISTDLSKMLRYVSNSDVNMVTIKNEIDYTIQYLNLMKVRYEDRLYWEIDISEEMNAVAVPRLVLQPLVENSIKHASEISSQGIIDIQGSITENTWKIEVEDNGPGMDDWQIAELEKKLAGFNPEKNIPEAQIDGMGLLNIFARLKLAYGEEAVFTLQGSAYGGLKVTIGGKINE